MFRLSRRDVLLRLAVAPVASVAGCADRSTETPSATATPEREREYDHLGRTPTYVSDDVGLRLPETTPRVSAASNADLVVLHGNPAADAERAVTWLADGRVVALLGERAQRTWREWTRSEAYRDAFGGQARSEADPTPHLLVAAARGTDVTTSRFSWGDLPSNSELLDALEEALGDVETWTPNEEG